MNMLLCKAVPAIEVFVTLRGSWKAQCGHCQYLCGFLSDYGITSLHLSTITKHQLTLQYSQKTDSPTGHGIDTHTHEYLSESFLQLYLYRY